MNYIKIYLKWIITVTIKQDLPKFINECTEWLYWFLKIPKHCYQYSFDIFNFKFECIQLTIFVTSKIHLLI